MNHPYTYPRCWFCNKEDHENNMFYGSEFDTFYHDTCLNKKLEKAPDDIEANIFLNEHKDLLKK